MTLQPLHLGPAAPAWIIAVTWPMLMVHIACGLAGIATGYTAMLAPKGSPLHRAAGNLFFLSMLGMLGLGGLIAAVEPGNRGTAVGAVFGLYLTATAWSAARRPDGPAGRIERAGFWVPLILGLTIIALSLIAFARPHAPEPQTIVGLTMGAIALLAARSDRKVIRHGMAGADRIVRHLWRMSTAMFFATGSFVLGQQEVMPHAVQGSPVLILLAVAPLLLMIVWLFRVRLGRGFKRPVPAAA